MTRSLQQTTLERMAQYIVEPENGSKCTGWSGQRDKDGYPLFWHNGGTRRASRVLWEVLFGPIPNGLIIRHICDNPGCLQADHLTLGTYKDNTGDALRKGRMVGPRKVDRSLKSKINLDRAAGETPAHIAQKYSISVSTVYSYLDRRQIKVGNYARGAEHWNSRKPSGDEE